MRTLDSFMIAVKSLRLAKIRTILCILAISIGICAVCIIRGLGSCAKTMISEELGTLGIRGTTYYIDGTGSFSDDALDQFSRFSEVTAVTPVEVRTGFLNLRDRRFTGIVCGVNDEIMDVFSLNVLYGRGLSASDIQEKNRVLLLDAATAKRAYGRENVIGKQIEMTISGISDTFEIVGVIEAQQGGLEGILGQSLPSVCYAPHTALNEMKNIKPTMYAVSFVNNESEQIRAKICDALDQMCDDGTNVRFQNLDSYENSFLTVSNTITWFIAGVAAISALVAGIGIMNTMLSAVDMRTHEIGVYIALGAQKSDLARNFLLETVMICILGGVLGSAIYVGSFILLEVWIGQVIQVELEQIALGILIALACGIMFGILPAIKVSLKNPVEILKAD